VPGFLAALLPVTRQTKHALCPKTPQKRRSTAALQNVTAVPRAEFSLASWSAAVFRRFGIVGSLLRDIIPTDSEAKLAYWSV
jgi:hypothetical protein